jgi:hypothetical protein
MQITDIVYRVMANVAQSFLRKKVDVFGTTLLILNSTPVKAYTNN